MSEEHMNWRKWKRSVNTSRRSIVKTMGDLGYRSTVYTKRDKGRTIMIVHGTGAAFEDSLARAVSKVNERWAERLVLNGRPNFIGVSEYLSHDNGHTLVLTDSK